VCSDKHVVDNTHELHDSLVQVEVLQALEEVGVAATVRAHHRYLLRLGLGGEDVDVEVKTLKRHGMFTDVLQPR